jgi:hypothetical protein
LTITEKAQHRWGYVCAGLGAGLMGAAWAAVIGFATLDYDKAREAELMLQDGHGSHVIEVERGDVHKGAVTEVVR